MKKGIILPGYACKSWIWENVKNNLDYESDIRLIDWPTKMTPHFHSLDDFVDWLYNNKIKTTESIDFVIGHSMGGLIALLLAKHNPNIKKVILVESFILTPNKFFQNLMMDNAPKDLVKKVIEMLKKEKNFYSSELGEKLRDLDLKSLVLNLECDISIIYGDRGFDDLSKVSSLLNWQSDLNNRINLYKVHNACHFPMLENPNETISILNKLI